MLEKFKGDRSISADHKNEMKSAQINSERLTSKINFSLENHNWSVADGAVVRDDTREESSIIGEENTRESLVEKNNRSSDSYEKTVNKASARNFTSASYTSNVSNDTSQPNNGSSSSKDGVRFVKVDASGASLPATAKSWACIFDRNTKLLWEINGLNKLGFSSGFKYRWDDGANEDFGATKNPDDKIKECSYFSGAPNSNNDKCTTAIYQLAANYMSLCGNSNWTLPSILNMHSIVKHGQFDPAVELQYFPFTRSGYYWSSEGFAYTEDRAWAMHYAIGNKNDVEKSEFHNIMLISRDAYY
jgi:hypothetical protein